MTLLPRWSGLRRHRAHEVELEQQVTRLQVALAQCRNAAGYWVRLRTPLKIAILVLIVALGFMLGAYSDQLRQSVADLRLSLGLASPDIGAAYAAYERREYDKALQLSRPLADAGDARARTLMGLMYLTGRAVVKDPSQAAQWFLLAAQERDAEAQFHLGNLYSEGLGVPQDYAEAVRWYRLAADQGKPQAQYNLGLWYATGEGGERDNVSAHMRFNLAATRFAASNSRERSIKNRDIVASKMTPEEVAEAQRLAREWRPK